MNIYARITNDGYLVYAATEDDYSGSDSYWPDYYSEDRLDLDTVFLANVPDSLATALCDQGSAKQYFSDGYDAWQMALPYCGKVSA